ncbi:hypothetical protein, partial [Bacillus massilinigeriensis]|uniref:hypothetical protein n=1 Tax=Bacillus massilionigeriensis TaxID=1805475 RepID=UPI001C54DF3B
LHVLGTPPAFVLSQDQTLRKRVRLALIILKIELTLTYGLFSFQRTISSPSLMGDFYTLSSLKE